MGVIITGMDMPKSCIGCKLKTYKNSELPFPTCIDEETQYSRRDNISGKPINCPLRSVEGLIEELEHHRRKTEPINKYDLVGDCIDIIRKYCEGGE